jgi:predicted RNA methylase
MTIMKSVEARRIELQARLDALKTAAERNKLGQFATPTALALDIMEHARSLLSPTSAIRFLDPAIGTGSFYSALLRSFPDAQIADAVGYEIDSHYGHEATRLWVDTPLKLKIADFTCAATRFKPTAAASRSSTGSSFS